MRPFPSSRNFPAATPPTTTKAVDSRESRVQSFLSAKTPLQAVGRLSVEEVLPPPDCGLYHRVFGAPLTVDAEAFKSPARDLEGMLREIIARLREAGYAGWISIEGTLSGLGEIRASERFLRGTMWD